MANKNPSVPPPNNTSNYQDVAGTPVACREQVIDQLARREERLVDQLNNVREAKNTIERIVCDSARLSEILRDAGVII